MKVSYFLFLLLGKYNDDEANVEDVSIIPKIEIVKYSIDSSINKNKSVLSAAVLNEGFNKISYSNKNIPDTCKHFNLNIF